MKKLEGLLLYGCSEVQADKANKKERRRERQLAAGGCGVSPGGREAGGGVIFVRGLLVSGSHLEWQIGGKKSTAFMF